MTLIDRSALREKVNKLYATATAEQRKVLLGVMELVETAPPYMCCDLCIPGGEPQKKEEW